MHALRCAGAAPRVRAAGARQGRPVKRADVTRAAPPLRAARSPLRGPRRPEDASALGVAAAALSPRRAAASTAEAPPLPILSEPAAPAPGSAVELRRRSETPDAAQRRRLEAEWAQPSVSRPAARSFSGRDIPAKSAAAAPRSEALAAEQRRRSEARADDSDDADDDDGTVRRAPLGARGQRLLAKRTLAQQRALSMSRATSRRAIFESRTPAQRLHANGRPVFDRSQLLTKDEEVVLIRRAQASSALEAAADELYCRLGTAPSMEQIAYHTGLPREMVQHRLAFGRQARQLMLERNVRLVQMVARRFQGSGLTLSDLVEEGNQGLLRSIDKFDISKGYKFSTYAHFWIRQAVSRAVHDQGRSVRLPIYVVEMLSKIRKAQNQLRQARGEEPTHDEVGRMVNLPAAKVARLLDLSRDVSTLEAPMMMDGGRGMSGDENGTLGDILVPEPEERPEQQMQEEQHVVDDINALLNTLEPRERNVLRMHYGLAMTQKGRAMTRLDVGSTYGITRERVRQIEDTAMRKLREPARLTTLRRPMIR